jgi:ribosomal-protein-alanine N-acetyltransferase
MTRISRAPFSAFPTRTERAMEIRTERLLLREISEERDWPAVLAYHRDPRYARFYDQPHETEDDVRRFLHRITRWHGPEHRGFYNLAVTLPETGKMIGIAGLRQRDPEQPRGDLGYEIAPPHWGRGYATEAARALLAFGFRDLGLHRIFARCLAENAASARVLERLGMRLEARHREHEWVRGRPRDELTYGILAPEWLATSESPPILT